MPRQVWSPLLLASGAGLFLAVGLCMLGPAILGRWSCGGPAGALMGACPAGGWPAMAAMPAMDATGRFFAVAAVALAGSLIGVVVLGAARHRRMARALARAARPATIHGHDVGLVTGIGAAFVAGLARPRIYCADNLTQSLDDEELRAVMLHERHHQLDRAPLRLVFLSALVPYVRWSGAGRTATEQASSLSFGQTSPPGSSSGLVRTGSWSGQRCSPRDTSWITSTAA